MLISCARERGRPSLRPTGRVAVVRARGRWSRLRPPSQRPVDPLSKMPSERCRLEPRWTSKRSVPSTPKNTPRSVVRPSCRPLSASHAHVTPVRLHVCRCGPHLLARRMPCRPSFSQGVLPLQRNSRGTSARRMSSSVKWSRVASGLVVMRCATRPRSSERLACGAEPGPGRLRLYCIRFFSLFCSSSVCGVDVCTNASYTA